MGRLVDTQEFENLRFKVRRYEPGLLSEFRLAATGSVHESDGYVIVDHAYLQRRVTPLPTYFLEETDTAQIRRVVVDFGYFIKDLAAAGLFPADLFNTWNYGVTEGRRVVLFDYDDVVPLEDVHFLRKPGPRDEFEETHEDAEWLAAGPCDFFLDELGTFLGIPDSLRGTFCGAHRDLFTLDYWRSVRSRVAAGEIIDIIPYDRSKRFRRSSREV